MNIALINTNRISPPVSPIGLEYVGETLQSYGFDVDVLDLCWADEPESALQQFFKDTSYGLCGVTLRNTDDCSWNSSHSFIPSFLETLTAVRSLTDAMVVLGGAGFSVFPDRILSDSAADGAVWGEGEFTFLELARALAEGKSVQSVPGFMFREEDRLIRNPAHPPSLDTLPQFRRRLFDNPRYFREGGQIGFETKRGCTGRCIYCADPVSKGNSVRLRPPSHISAELRSLAEQGINWFHTCDSEFNIPYKHAMEICSELVETGLASEINWYAYCSPAGFSPELARLMAAAGCKGINFGADSGDPAMLSSLGREFSPEDIMSAVRLCRENGMSVMLDLLFGGPGESEESVRKSIEFVKECDPDAAGVAAGIRLYPGTSLSALVGESSGNRGVTGGDGLISPLYFIDPVLGEDLFDLIDSSVAGDSRFFFMNPRNPAADYNYSDNELLTSEIRKGARGAYWDILRKIR